jgi:hypothetical protein
LRKSLSIYNHRSFDQILKSTCDHQQLRQSGRFDFTIDIYKDFLLLETWISVEILNEVIFTTSQLPFMEEPRHIWPWVVRLSTTFLQVF